MLGTLFHHISYIQHKRNLKQWRKITTKWFSSTQFNIIGNFNGARTPFHFPHGVFGIEKRQQYHLIGMTFFSIVINYKNIYTLVILFILEVFFMVNIFNKTMTRICTLDLTFFVTFKLAH